MEDEVRREILRQWRASRREFERLWSRENKRARELFEGRFVESAARRWGVAKDEVRKVVDRE